MHWRNVAVILMLLSTSVPALAEEAPARITSITQGDHTLKDGKWGYSARLLLPWGGSLSGYVGGYYRPIEGVQVNLYLGLAGLKKPFAALDLALSHPEVFASFWGTGEVYLNGAYFYLTQVTLIQTQGGEIRLGVEAEGWKDPGAPSSHGVGPFATLGKLGPMNATIAIQMRGGNLQFVGRFGIFLGS